MKYTPIHLIIKVMKTIYNTVSVRYADLKEGKYYLHSELGIVRLGDKPNICVSTENGEYYFVKLNNLFEIKNNLLINH